MRKRCGCLQDVRHPWMLPAKQGAPLLLEPEDLELLLPFMERSNSATLTFISLSLDLHAGLLWLHFHQTLSKHMDRRKIWILYQDTYIPSTLEYQHVCHPSEVSAGAFPRSPGNGSGSSTQGQCRTPRYFYTTNKHS